MLMRPNKAETAAHGCHCPGDMAVRMRKVLARPWVGVRVCHLLLLLLIFLSSDVKTDVKRFLTCDGTSRGGYNNYLRKKFTV